MPRSVSGNYTLPLPPVAANTVIQAAWANTSLDDIAQGITDSLDRYGRGGLVAPFRFIDGSEALPAWAFSSETGTGMWRDPGGGILAISILGSKVAQWSAAGLLAGDITALNGTIQTLSVTDILTSTVDADSLIVTGPAHVTGSVLFDSTLEVVGDTYMHGKLGVGVAPAAKLHVSDSVNQLARFDSTAATGGYIGFLTSGTLQARVGVGGNVVTGSSLTDLGLRSDGGNIYFAAGSGVEKMRIDTAGNVSIGQVAPGARLHVVAPDDARLILDGTGSGIGSGGTILFARTGVTKGSLGVQANRFGDSSGNLFLHANDYLRVNTGPGVGTTAFEISGSNQFIGIGRGPGVKVDILGVNNVVGWGGNNDLRISSQNATVATTYGWNQMGTTGDYAWGNAGGERMRMYSAGTIGIGQAGGTVTASGLEIKGNANPLILHGPNAGGYVGMRLYNDSYNSGRSVEINYSGTSWAGQFVTDSPVGEQAAIVTTGLYPMSIGTGNRCRIMIPAASASPVLIYQSGNPYAPLLDPGTLGTLGIGSMFGAEANGASFGGLQAGAIIALNASNTLTAYGYTVAANIVINSGQFRLLGRLSANFGIWMKVA
jgi:hypothetical protein